MCEIEDKYYAQQDIIIITHTYLNIERQGSLVCVIDGSIHSDFTACFVRLNKNQ